MSKRRPITLSILATPDTTPSHLFGLFDVLSSVGLGWESFVAGKPGDPMFDVRIVAATRDPISYAGNVLVSPHLSVKEAKDTDIALVASFATPPLFSQRQQNERELDWLISQQHRGATMVSSCAGAIMLAHTGILDGLEATSHWGYFEMLRSEYPEVRWRIEKNLCISGNNDQIVTSGGATAWQELVLYLITRFCGVEHAVHSAKLWLIPCREENQAPFATMSQIIQHDDGVVKICQEWIAYHYDNPNPITAMVKLSELPPTTFARRFKRATGYRPMDYVHILRVEEAKQMLEMSGNAVDQIGREVGYEDPASFRRIFKRTAGLTPSIYRRRFGRGRFEQYERMQLPTN
jgi:transcriptional regulator GlxA family with amidase domain